MRVLFCGGGTAGHVTPALALAEEFKRRYRGCAVAFVGRSGGSESKLVTDAGYKLYEINIRGFSRKLCTENLKTLKVYFDARREAKKIIDEFRPSVVIGTGGYVSAPIISEAAKRKIFTLIHESNATLGFTTRMLAGKCDRLLLGADIKTRFKNAEFVGNPVSDRFGAISKHEARLKLGMPSKKRLIISVGGSIGAGKLNESVIEFMKTCASKGTDVYHIHGCGKRFYDEIRAAVPELCSREGRMHIVPFIDDMPLYLAAADILICRCGAMTLAEAARSGCPTIMIPSPNVTNDHQTKNALAYAAAGAGILIEEKDLTPEALEKIVIPLIKDEGRLTKMGDAARALFKTDPKGQSLDIVEAHFH